MGNQSQYLGSPCEESRGKPSYGRLLVSIEALAFGVLNTLQFHGVSQLTWCNLSGKCLETNPCGQEEGETNPSEDPFCQASGRFVSHHQVEIILKRHTLTPTLILADPFCVVLGFPYHQVLRLLPTTSEFVETGVSFLRGKPVSLCKGRNPFCGSNLKDTSRMRTMRGTPKNPIWGLEGKPEKSNLGSELYDKNQNPIRRFEENRKPFCGFNP